MEILWVLFNNSLAEIVEIAIKYHYDYFTCNQMTGRFRFFYRQPIHIYFKNYNFDFIKALFTRKEREII